MTYDAARTFADSWGLVLMAVSFIGFVGWAFRPGSKAANDAARNAIFRDEDANDG